MITMKFKETTKLKSSGKCDLLRRRLCDEVSYSFQQKDGYKDYINEIFAGLMWLG